MPSRNDELHSIIFEYRYPIFWGDRTDFSHIFKTQAAWETLADETSFSNVTGNQQWTFQIP
jgi:hypothetical protein